MNFVSKIPAGCLLAGAVCFIGYAIAANPPKKEARVTQIIRDVQLLPAGSAPRPAVQDDQVSENTGVRTGDESRSELTFEDLTITRLGANTIFSFNKAGRSGELESGAILLRVPKNSGGAEFRTRALTVGITGTTVILESTRLGNANLIVLEGGASLRLNKYPKESKKVRAGQMLKVPAGAAKLAEPEDADLEQITKTHPLLTDFPPLPSDNLIKTSIKKQQTGGSNTAPVSQGTPVVTKTPRPAPVATGIPATATPFFPTAPPKPGNFPTKAPTSTPTQTTGTSGNYSPTPPKGVGPTRVPRAKGTKGTPNPTGTPRFSLPPQTGNVYGTPTPSGQTIIPNKKAIRNRTPTPTPTPPKIN
jgi:hypothetical protein